MKVIVELMSVIKLSLYSRCNKGIFLGSSMRTSPFCDLPSLSKCFVVCNKQNTPYDKEAKLCIHDNIDNFMKRIFNHLCKSNLTVAITFTR